MIRRLPRVPGTLLLLLAAVVLLPSAASADPPADDAAWKAAAALKSARRYEEAAAAFVAYADEHPMSPEAVDALIEAGLARFAEGRAAQRLHRNPPGAETSFRAALALFERAASHEPGHPSAPRARYMSGSAAYFLWDLPGAAERYRMVVQSYGPAEPYYAKSAIRLAEVLFSMLEAEGGLTVLQNLQADLPGLAGDQADRAERYRRYATQFGRAAAPLSDVAWIQGGPLRLADLRGRPVALYFSTFWCPNCRKEREFIKDIARRFAERGLAFVEITDASRGQTLDSVRSSVGEWGIEHPVAFDGDGRVFAAYEGRSIPNLVLIDRNGNVRWHDHPAALADWTLEKLLE